MWKVERSHCLMENDKLMMEKGDDACNKGASGAPNLEIESTNHCSEDSRINSIDDELCDGDPILSNQIAKVNSDSYNYLLTQPVDDLSFFGNEEADKENGDLLYCSWPEIENFEDVDKMFRDCDSTFGLGIDNEDEMGWFSSSNAIEEFNDAAKLSFKTPDSDAGSNGATEHDGAFRMNNIGLIADETGKCFTPVSWNLSSERGANSRAVASDNEGISHFATDSQKFSVGDQFKMKNLSADAVMGDRNLESPETFVHLSNINHLPGTEQSSGYEGTLSSNMFRGLHSPNPHLDPGNSDLSNQVLSSLTSSVAKPENHGQSTSQKGHICTSNQLPPVKSSRGLGGGGKKKGIPQRNGFSAKHSKHEDIAARNTMFSHPNTVQNQVDSFESEVECPGEVNANCTTSSIPAELDFSNVQESSCISSVLDEVSHEASSLRQLLLVMEKLDIKTKMCIRDSLYRLARSAEQRHICASVNGGSRFDEDGVMASCETNRIESKQRCRVITLSETKSEGPSSWYLPGRRYGRCNGFLDIETNTNPIDRSVAHLLFHRPSDPSGQTSNSAASPVVEKPISHEGSSAGGAE